MDNLGYLLGAFIFIWAILFGYLFVLNSRLKRLKSEVDTLNRSSR